jgi:microcin C transport system permease protein
MSAYIIRRLLFMIPTMFGIMLVAFAVVQFAPGGPVEQVIAKLSGSDTGATSRISGSPGGDFGSRGLAQGGSGVDSGGSIPNSSRSWKSNSVSTSRRPSVSR